MKPGELATPSKLFRPCQAFQTRCYLAIWLEFTTPQDGQLAQEIQVLREVTASYVNKTSQAGGQWAREFATDDSLMAKFNPTDDGWKLAVLLVNMLQQGVDEVQKELIQVRRNKIEIIRGGN